MLDVETNHQIILLYFKEGLSLRKIAKQLKISRNTAKARIVDRTWFIHQGNDGQNYYWNHNPGADQTVRTADNGQWKSYQTGEQIAAAQTEQLTRGLSLGFALAVAAPFAVEAMTVTGEALYGMLVFRKLFKLAQLKHLLEARPIYWLKRPLMVGIPR